MDTRIYKGTKSAVKDEIKKEYLFANTKASKDIDLAISKSLSPAAVEENGEVTYTFVIQNSGSEAGAEAAVVITDVFDPILSDLRVTLDGAPMARAAYSYDEATGTFSTAAGQLRVPGAVFTQNADGSWMTTPGITVLTVSGII